MSKFSRVFSILKSLLMIIIGSIILLVPNEIDYVIVCCIIGITITLTGLRKLIYYFSSAKNMVGGRKILIKSIIHIDLGLLSFFVLTEDPKLAILYMVAVFMLLGAIDILRSFEIKRNGSKTWIVKLIKGILTIGVGVVCIFLSKYTETMLILFGCAWIVLAIEDIISAFSKSAVTYVPEI